MDHPHGWLEAQLAEKIREPNSGLGTAITYLLRHWHLLSLLATYHREDLARALERAARYRAFSWSAVERILAAQARPRTGWESLAAEAREQLGEMLRQSSLDARSTAEYQPLLEETAIRDEKDDDDPVA